MAIPSTATSLGTGTDANQDPQAIKDYRINVATALESPELVDPAAWTLTLLAEATALGLIIGAAAPYPAPALNGGGYAIDLWARIDQTFAGNAAFVAGVPLPMVLTFQTDSAPPRKDQATFYQTFKEK